jgi:hypothetical protein
MEVGNAKEERTDDDRLARETKTVSKSIQIAVRPKNYEQGTYPPK